MAETEAVFASGWILQVIPPGGLMVPEAALPLYRLHIHTCDSSQATHTLSGFWHKSVGEVRHCRLARILAFLP